MCWTQAAFEVHAMNNITRPLLIGVKHCEILAPVASGESKGLTAMLPLVPCQTNPVLRNASFLFPSRPTPFWQVGITVLGPADLAHFVEKNRCAPVKGPRHEWMGEQVFVHVCLGDVWVECS